MATTNFAGMVDLGDLSTFSTFNNPNTGAAFAPAGANAGGAHNAALNGMVHLFGGDGNATNNTANASSNPLGAMGFGYKRMPPSVAANNKRTAANASAAPISIETHSNLITESGKAITLAASMAMNTTDADEKEFWQLFTTLLEDAERTPSYAPERIGINTNSAATNAAANGNGSAAPSLFSASRRWYITHYAFIQDLLMRHEPLRRLALILRWLELSYANRFDGYRSLRFGGRAATKDEVGLMREAIRAALRAGQMAEAIRIAESADDGITACMIAAAQMKAHPEGWNSQTAVVPLFGEYAHSDEPLEWGTVGGAANADSTTAVPPQQQPWTTNKDRIDHLATLMDWSELPDVEGDEAIIAAILSGNESVLSKAYDTRRWQDELWVKLRSGFVKIFTKAISVNGEPIPTGTFRDGFEAMCPPTKNWLETAVDKLTKDVITICHKYLGMNNTNKTTAAASAVSVVNSLTQHLPLAEELQIRLIVQSLPQNACGVNSVTIFDASAGVVAASAASSAAIADTSSVSKKNIAFLAALNVISHRAFGDRLITVSPQQQTAAAARNNSSSDAVFAPYAKIFAEYCAAIITSPRLQSADASRRVCLLLFSIVDTTQRAKAAAQIIFAARQMWYNSYVAGSNNNNTTTMATSPNSGSSSAILVSPSSPSSSAQLDQRRAYVYGKEKWLMELFRRFNFKKFGAAKDDAFVFALLKALEEGLTTVVPAMTAPTSTVVSPSSFDDVPAGAAARAAVATAAASAATIIPRLASDTRAEVMMWRIALWINPSELCAAGSASATASSATSGTSSGAGSGVIATGVAAATTTTTTEAAVVAICNDLCATLTALWADRHYKAITEVMAAHTKHTRPLMERLEATETLLVAGGGTAANAASSASSVTVASSIAVKQLGFWGLFAQLLSTWDVLTTLSVNAAAAAKDRAIGQLAIFAAEEQHFRNQLFMLVGRAVQYEHVMVTSAPSCAGALLKCVELAVNAAVVAINFPGQNASLIAEISQTARDQLLLVHEAIAIAAKDEVSELFTAFRVLRLDSGIRKLKANVAAALA